MRPSRVVVNRMLYFIIVCKETLMDQLKEQDWLLGFGLIGVVDTY